MQQPATAQPFIAIPYRRFPSHFESERFELMWHKKKELFRATGIKPVLSLCDPEVWSQHASLYLSVKRCVERTPCGFAREKDALSPPPLSNYPSERAGLKRAREHTALDLTSSNCATCGCACPVSLTPEYPIHRKMRARPGLASRSSVSFDWSESHSAQEAMEETLASPPCSSVQRLAPGARRHAGNNSQLEVN